MTVAPKTDPNAAPFASIVIATFDEKNNIRVTIEAIFAHVTAPTEVIVVDDNSPDGTGDIVAGIDDPRITLIRRKRARGVASAIMRGVMESRGDVVCWIDAEMHEETSCLPRMIDMTKDHDVVIASRFVEGGSDCRHPFLVASSRLVNAFANLVLGYGIKDYTSCVVAVRRTVFDEAMPIAYGFGDFFIEFIYDCCRRGLDVVEMPFALLPRTEGQSKSFPNLPGFLWLGAKYCVRIMAIRFRPD